LSNPEEILLKAKVLIATPCYGGVCSADYMTSMTQLAALSVMHKIDISIVTIKNESLVTRARNNLASQFLADPTLTHLMFIDSDIGFSPNDVIKLILRDKDVIAGPYPQKQLNWKGIQQSAQSTGSEEDMKISSLVFTHSVKDEGGVIQTRLDMPNDVFEVDYVGTGFMLIKREVFEKLRDSMSDDDWYKYPDSEIKMYDFFPVHIDKVNRLYLGEDWTFCSKWKALGGQIWIDGTIRLRHIGSYTFGL